MIFCWGGGGGVRVSNKILYSHLILNLGNSLLRNKNEGIL